MEAERRIPELLAPAGSLECLEAALNFGADAVYMGGPKFGARAYASNPDTEDYLKAIDSVHLRGRKIYLTVNTLFKPDEIGELYDYLLPYYQAGVDAVLVQDLGAARQIHADYPDLPIYASTQMTVMSAPGARCLKNMGIERLVAARELTIPEIRTLTDTGIEVEVFIHGAICYCYSGQCLMSSLIGGRSGNRGRCAQPCRLPWSVTDESAGGSGRHSEGYLLSLKDMDTLSCLPRLAQAGVRSLKIEGRMKNPRYTGGVTAVYRKYLDLYLSGEEYKVDPDDRRYLRELFDRGGYTSYAEKGLHDGMIALSKPRQRLPDERFMRARESAFKRSEQKEKINGTLIFHAGSRAQLSAGNGKAAVSVEGDVVQNARSSPISASDLRERFSRLGDTPFIWEDLKIETDGRGFLPVSQLNELRRAACAQLENKILSSFHRDVPAGRLQDADNYASSSISESISTFKSPHELLDAHHSDAPYHRQTPYICEREDRQESAPEITVLADTMEQIFALRDYPDVSRLYVNISSLTEAEEEQTVRMMDSLPPVWVSLPAVLRPRTLLRLEKSMRFWHEAGAEGYLVHTLDEAAWIAELLPGARMQADSSVYTWNIQAAAVLKELGVEGTTLPVELNERELCVRLTNSPLPSELIVYGYLPVMVSAQCVRRTVSGCSERPGVLRLTDRRGRKFPARNCCRYCFNEIYNSVPLYLADCLDDEKAPRPDMVRISFTVEDEKTTRLIMDACLSDLRSGTQKSLPVAEYTRGHWRRGVE